MRSKLVKYGITLAASVSLLLVPSAAFASPTNTYEVQRGDTLSDIGADLGIKWKDLASFNNIDYPYVLHIGQKLKLSLNPKRTVHREILPYLVLEGDSLSEIGAALGVKWEELAELNGLTAPYTIFQDQELKLPKSYYDSQSNAYSIMGKIKLHDATRLYGLDSEHNSRVSRLAAAELGPMFGIKNIGGYATSGHVNNSDHYPDETGHAHALDLGTSSISNGKQVGDDLAAYAIANFERLNIKYVIWYREIWFPGQGWHSYSGPSDHTDHVHLSFNS